MSLLDSQEDTDLLQSFTEELFGDISSEFLTNNVATSEESPSYGSPGEDISQWMNEFQERGQPANNQGEAMEVTEGTELTELEEVVSPKEVEEQQQGFGPPLKRTRTRSQQPQPQQAHSPPTVVSPPPSGNQDCKVCGRKGSGTKSAFGGRSCTSCRAFFLRAIQSGRGRSYSCPTEDCRIDSRSWKSCQRCRYKRCIDLAGMREELVGCNKGVTSPSSTVKKGSKLPATTCIVTSAPSGEVAEEEQKPEVVPEYPLVQAPIDQFTLEESLLLQGLHSFTADCVAKIYLAMAQLRMDFIEDMCKCLTGGANYGWHNMIFMTKTIVSLSPMFYQSLGDMQHLDKSDQMLLLQSNFPMVMELTMANIVESKSNTNRHLNRLIKKAFSERRDVAALLKGYNITPDTVLDSVKYHQLYNADNAMGYKNLMRHKELCLTLGQWTQYSPHDPDRKSDEIMITLISMIIIFSGSGLALKNPDMVQDIQKKYSHMLFRYFKDRHPDSVLSQHRFYMGMSSIDLLREAVNLKMSAMPQDLIKVKSSCPTLTEISTS